MQEVRKQKSKLNKGFSLVELIVVIAIMAVLVGVIATQFVKYVGESNKTVDDSNLKILKDAADVTLSSDNFGDFTSTNATVTIDADGEATFSNNLPADFKTKFEANLDLKDNGTDKIYPASSDGNSIVITITGSATQGYTTTIKIQ